jgi:hypothetical protein
LGIISNIQKLGKGHRGQDADDAHHDQQFDQGEALGLPFALAEFAEQFELEFGAHGCLNTSTCTTIRALSWGVHTSALARG